MYVYVRALRKNKQQNGGKQIKLKSSAKKCMLLMYVYMYMCVCVLGVYKNCLSL